MIEIRASVSPKVSFASHQNAVPLLAELTIVSVGEEALDDILVELTSDPEFVEPRVWRVDRLAPDALVHVTDRDVALHASMLSGLNEGIKGTLRLAVRQGDEVLARQDHAVELLARSEWGGASSMAELLAAFVMPNDPAVDRVLKAASDVLRRAGKKDGIDGYEAKSRTRVWELASAIWSSVVGLRLSYALPPASFETNGQKVRAPSAILQGGIATCLDTAVLFAAAIEQAGLNPLVILTKGHAFAGVWLQPQEFASLVTDDAAAVRKRVDLKELAVFETTLATQAYAPSFSRAADVGRRQIAEEVDDQFVMALDLRRARMRRIRPLADTQPGALRGDEGERQDGPAPFEEAPSLPGFDVEVVSEPKDEASRIALWRRKLLDLTTRNRLLNLAEGAKSVRLICADVGALEDRLADGKRIKVVTLPDLGEGGRDEAIHRLRTGELLKDEYVRSALDRNEVFSDLEIKRLDASLVELFRKAKTDLEEGGANTLFLALGFLKWRKAAEDSRTYRAPLILLPVRLERKSAVSGVTMVRHDDEARFNLTLLELLRQDFQLRIPSLEGSLPADGSGIDVAGVWNIVRKEVRDIAHFEVVEDVVLSTFSFAKYLMWKDLTDRADQLKESPVVRHLIERAQERFPAGPDYPDPQRLDDIVDPADLFTPLPADSSQLAAVVASARGSDFVLDGPPGTGKSQTIANMIAHNMALGRRVLFVAEKRAALDVVFRRLAEKGLGEFCLELHSTKATKSEVVKNLGRAWDTRDALSAEEWTREASQVRRLRDRLNEVVRLLHVPHRNGMTLHRAIGRVVRDWTPATPALTWPRTVVQDAAGLEALRDLVRRLQINWASSCRLPLSAFEAVERRDWSNGWQESVLSAARELLGCLSEERKAREALIASFRLPATGLTLRASADLARLADAILGVHGLDMSCALAPDGAARVTSARGAAEAASRFRAAEASLSAPFARDAVVRLDVDAFDLQWQAAARRTWPFSLLARRSVSKRLRSTGQASGKPRPDVDLPLLRGMKDSASEVGRLADGLVGVPSFNGVDTDGGLLEWAVRAETLRTAIVRAAGDPEILVTLRGAVLRLVVNGNELLADDGPLSAQVRALSERERSLNEAVAGLDSLLECASDPDRSLEDLRTLAEALVTEGPRLKAWCDWRRVSTEASDAGLQPIATALRAGTIPEGRCLDVFEASYARWFAVGAIDAEPRLRDLVTAEHADDIETFRRLDDRLSALSVRYIRARICGLLPDKASVGRKDGFGILKHELQKQRNHKPIRQLAGEMGDAFARLAPCMLMSPLSIAQYLPAEQALFDLVIFDEASQIAPWDAVGSIARGRQVVVAGDPRQMPPSNFFNRSAASGDDDLEPDMESILDECLAAGVPNHALEWHYRSRHESLIAFSNHRYYEGKLITFPAAVTRDSAVTWRRVEGVYAKGRGRTNQVEAAAIVEEVVRRLKAASRHGMPASIAVVTLNSEQQALVENLLDVRRKDMPELEAFFGEGVLDPVVVKNLETVQGDERDVVLIGVGYGPTEPGSRSMSMNFGPLNKDGGWRRLNVAITRARKEMVVFTSFDPQAVDLNRTSAPAVRDLKHFLEFAERGPNALAEAIQGSVGGYESPFEEAVASALRAKGWNVVPQIGVSRFRIDLGIVHPDRPGDYLAGVECDGATYHSAATARDRDKVRANILEGLGWSLVRVWSTDWWVDKAGATERLDQTLRSLLQRSREAIDDPGEEQPVVTADDAALVDAGDVFEEAEDTVLEPEPREGSSVFARRVESGLGSRPYAHASAALDGCASSADAGAFYEPAYDEVLARMVASVLAVEAPVAADELVNRIARVHGFQRSGRVIRERVLAVAARDSHLVTDADGIVFIWLDSAQRADWSCYRTAPAGQPGRSIEDICLEEIRCAVLTCTEEDSEAQAARLLGIRRVGAAARRRIQSAMSELPH